MQRSETLIYQSVVLKQHESKIQERRQERKSEMQRLDGLKKTLEEKLRMSPRSAANMRVA